MGFGAATTVAYALGVAYVIGGLLLWFFPMLVAHKLLPRTTHTNHLNPQGYDLARVGCGLLGLWLCARALPTVVWLLFRAFLFVDAGSTFSSIPLESKLEVSVAFFEVLLGGLIVIKAALFAHVLVPNPHKAPSEEQDV